MVNQGEAAGEDFGRFAFLKPETRSLLKTDVLQSTIAALADRMGCKLPTALEKVNEAALDGLSLNYISFLVYYGHHFEAGSMPAVIKDLMRDWMEVSGCDIHIDFCYKLRTYYHMVILGHIPPRRFKPGFESKGVVSAIRAVQAVEN